MTNRLSALEWVKREDAECREERAERLEWLMQLYPENQMVVFPGGLLTKILFEEARYAFVHALFAASTLLALAFIERCLAALFYGAGWNDLERASLHTLSNQARSLGVLDAEYFNELESLRKLRNPLAHFRSYESDDRIEVRAVRSMLDPTYEGLIPEEIVANDAVRAMKLVMQTLREFCAPESLLRFPPGPGGQIGRQNAEGTR
jgi:hypothetical protein